MNKISVAMLQTPMFPLNLSCCAGVERVELDEMDGLVENGHAVGLFVPGLYGVKEGVSSIKDWGWRNRLLKFAYYLDFGIRARTFDVFHGHYTPILGLLYPQKSLVHLHGQAVFMLPQYERFKHRYHQAHYAFNSKFIKRAFEDKYHAVPKHHLHLLYNGIDCNKFYPDSDKKGNRIINLCFCGRWTREKGIFFLLDAVKKLEKKRKDFKLFIVGSANIPVISQNSIAIEKIVKEFANDLSTVEIVGPLSHEELPQFYRNMDIGIVPSLWDEPFGLVVLEMMASGLPVIATRVGAIPEIIQNDMMGCLVEPNDVQALVENIESLIEKPDKRLSLGIAGRNRIKQAFSCGQHIESLIDIYRQILRGRKVT
ncbi:MAG: glycosyltransferase family 4 protein [Candidatus Margulisbacteria bacterium]|nr:glycosyltransferase family 4 protein [Candidatus Margulisiibacteriota bacterium]